MRVYLAFEATASQPPQSQSHTPRGRSSSDAGGKLKEYPISKILWLRERHLAAKASNSSAAAPASKSDANSEGSSSSEAVSRYVTNTTLIKGMEEFF